jgi:hypothetical protein
VSVVSTIVPLMVSQVENESILGDICGLFLDYYEATVFGDVKGGVVDVLGILG